MKRLPWWTPLLLACACSGAGVHQEPQGLDAGATLPPAAAPTTWISPPAGPSPTSLADALEQALAFRLRAEDTRLFDAMEPGEQLAHVFVHQSTINEGALGPAALFVLGDDLFEYEFRAHQGLGNGLAAETFPAAGPEPAPNLRRVHVGEFGGPDALNCAGCHSKGGLNGAGTQTQNAYMRGDGMHTLGADERNAPHVLGLGFVMALAAEMTRDLQTQRDDALARARAIGQPVKAVLETHGVAFGRVEGHPDGRVDTSRVEGVDTDLVIRPLGWKGHVATLQDFVEESFRVHMGFESERALLAALDGNANPDVQGNGTWPDLDADGVLYELGEGFVSAVAFYLAQLEVPVIRPPRTPQLLERFAEGQALFHQVGCTGCHVPSMVLKDTVLEIEPRVLKGSGPPPSLDVAVEGEHPKPEPVGAGTPGYGYRVALFSDLKRHDLGPALATPTVQAGIPPSVFLTRSLWGIADTAPFLHDGRAATLHDAILWHGGEAQASRDGYAALTPGEQASIRVFLQSLDRAPRVFVP